MIHSFFDLPPRGMPYVSGTAEVSGPGVEDIRLLEVRGYTYGCPVITHTLTAEQLQAVREVVRKDLDNPGLYEADPCFYGC